MPERLLFTHGKNGKEFAGSIDEDGRVYDKNHWYIGRISGNKVYDNCNKERATINANGEIWDINHRYVGNESGENFLDPMRQLRGSEEGAIYGHNRGCDYGVFQVLKDSEKATLRNPPVTDYNRFDESNDETSEEDSLGDDYMDDDTDYSYADPAPSPREATTWSSGTRDYGYDDAPSKSYVDVSKMGVFWGCVVSFFAGLMGKEIITRLDKINRRR